ncbi:MAG: hypothetical protein PSX80_09910 [bacterium]|nr:hypothetical protein [bacterium]
MMPTIEIANTIHGEAGNASVPAITKGVLGSRVKPRMTETARYIDSASF